METLPVELVRVRPARRAYVGDHGNDGAHPGEVWEARRVQSGAADDEFDQFCRSELAAVAGLAFVLTGDWGAAEDLAQEAFFAAFRRWDELRHYDKPEAWVRRVVANRAVSRRRRLASEARALARLGSHRAPVSSHGETPRHDIEISAVIRQLPKRQAQVFALTYISDLSVAQVADILSISADTTKTHLRRARAALSARPDLFELPPDDEEEVR